MPGDGITDVAPIAQNQEKGRSASAVYRRRREEYAYFDGWTELLWEWWPGIQDASIFPYRTRLARQRDVRIPQLEDRNEWFFTPVAAQYAVQIPGVDQHAGQAPVRKKIPDVSRLYKQVDTIIEVVIDPTSVSNIAAWLPAISMHGVSETRRAARMSSVQNSPFMTSYSILQVPQTSYYTQVSEAIGNTQITGGHFVIP